MARSAPFAPLKLRGTNPILPDAAKGPLLLR
jgi:hypothetical protein